METNINYEIEEFNQRIKKLENEFPRAIKIIDAGTNLYHYSKDEDSLVEADRFDPERSNTYGAFYFTPQPIDKYTNVVL